MSQLAVKYRSPVELRYVRKSSRAAPCRWCRCPETRLRGTRSSSWTQGRLWRKTRSRINGTLCKGVDSNQNFDYLWPSSRASRNPCNRELYCAPPPSLSRRRLRRDRLIHAWKYTENLTDSYERHVAMGNNVAAAGGPSIKVVGAEEGYVMSGGSVGYATEAAKISYSFGFELTDDHEFLLPERWLSEALPQYYQAFISFAEQIRKEFGAKVGGVTLAPWSCAVARGRRAGARGGAGGLPPRPGRLTPSEPAVSAARLQVLTPHLPLGVVASRTRSNTSLPFC
ncbi:unnamed protein product [Plutella xylostella]|uniref:(diamondback moth) hypothetical protein n=1 Tax=Plutella xylostella TaxID=51655 RepID=A0A8S4F9I8_PLUXY|nr:unnamed protein product [Plutella xylostella]